MQSIIPVNRYKLDDISHFLNALTHFPYINGITSLLSATYDLFDILLHLCKSNVLLRKLILKTALSRFFGNVILGIAKLTPLITVAAFMVTCPWLIPLISLIPVTADFIKHTKLAKEWKQLVHQNTLLFNDNPTEETLANLRAARDTLYEYTQERFICAGLILGATLSIAGLIFPPLLIAGIILSISSAAFGFLDKRYHYSKRVSQYIFGDFEATEDSLVKKNALVKTLTNTQNIFGATPAEKIANKNTSANQQSAALNQSSFFQAKKQAEKSTAPTLQDLPEMRRQKL